MNIVKSIDQFKINNVYFGQEQKNNVINDSKFLRIFYSTEYFALNGVFIIINLKNVTVDNYFSKVSSLGSPGIDEIRWKFPVRPGDKLMVRATIIETKLSRSKPDRGIVRTFIETINQQEDIVMSFRSVNFMLCRGSFTGENAD